MTSGLSTVKEKKNRPVLFCILLGIALTFAVSVASAVGTIIKLNESNMLVAQGLAFLVVAILLTVYMIKKDATLASFGFRKASYQDYKSVLFYLPLLLIALVQPLYGGFNSALSFGNILLIIIFSLIVGYTEEVLFRGIIRQQLIHKGPLFFIVFSSLFFGILHVANALSGKDITEVLLQILNAFLIGLILALLIERSNHIWPLITFHFLFNTLAQLSDPTINEHTVEIVSILNVLYLLYGSYLLFVRSRRKQAKV